MKNERVVIALFGIFAIALTIFISTLIKPNTTIDADTAYLCREYANRNHEKEIAPERWQKNGTWPDFDWYQSCIDHELHPVAGR